MHSCKDPQLVLPFQFVRENAQFSSISVQKMFLSWRFLIIRIKKEHIELSRRKNGNTFFDWIKNVILLLQKNSVIVIRNASYHSVKI